jgi:hypothetical protein
MIGTFAILGVVGIIMVLTYSAVIFDRSEEPFEDINYSAFM